MEWALRLLSLIAGIRGIPGVQGGNCICCMTEPSWAVLQSRSDVTAWLIPAGAGSRFIIWSPCSLCCVCPAIQGTENSLSLIWYLECQMASSVSHRRLLGSHLTPWLPPDSRSCKGCPSWGWRTAGPQRGMLAGGPQFLLYPVMNGGNTRDHLLIQGNQFRCEACGSRLCSRASRRDVMIVSWKDWRTKMFRKGSMTPFPSEFSFGKLSIVLGKQFL